MDNWFRTQAGQQTRKNVARVFVCIESESKAIAGFYTLSAGMIAHTKVENIEGLRATKYPDLPIVLLGRLAVSTSFQNMKLGNLLLTDAVKRCHAISQDLGVIGLAVDAKDSRANSFYAHHDFIAFPDTEFKLILPATAFSKFVNDKH